MATSHLHQDGPLTSDYMTLSHCWGSSPTFLKLTLANINSMRHENHVSVLPKTFSDAIMVARYLAVRFLWIDALCIIQDSHEDWLQESALMQEVYSNSLCNIAAAKSFDNDQGLFADRDEEQLSPTTVHTTWNAMPLQEYVLISDFWDREVIAAPLHTRAWVLQERLLAP